MNYINPELWANYAQQKNKLEVCELSGDVCAVENLLVQYAVNAICEFHSIMVDRINFTDGTYT